MQGDGQTESARQLGLEIIRTAAEEFTTDALLRTASVTFARREELSVNMRGFAPSLLRACHVFSCVCFFPSVIQMLNCGRLAL